MKIDHYFEACGMQASIYCYSFVHSYNQQPENVNMVHKRLKCFGHSGFQTLGHNPIIWEHSVYFIVVRDAKNIGIVVEML